MDSDFNIGNMIYVERKQAGMGRSEFAKLCFIAPDAMKRIEIGTRKVRPYELYEMAKQLGNTMEHYLGKPQLVDKSTTLDEMFGEALEALNNLGIRK